MRQATYVAIALLTLLMLALSACATPTGEVVGNDLGEDETVTIGMLASLSGAAALWGQNELNAAQLAVEEYEEASGSIDIQLAVEDMRSLDKKQAIAAYRALRTFHDTEIIIGPTWAESAGAIVPLVETDNNLLIMLSAGAKRDIGVTSEKVISFWPSDEYETDYETTSMKEHGVQTLAIIYNEDVYAEYMKEYLAQSAEDAGIVVVEEFGLDNSVRDYKTTLLAAKEADATYVVLSNPAELTPIVLRQRKELGIMQPYYLNMIETSEQFLEETRDLAEGVYFPSPATNPAYDAFAAKYEARYGEQPSSPSASIAYDAMNLIILALADGARTPEEVRDHILATENYPGATTTISFDEHGDLAGRAFVLKTIRHGVFVEVQ